MPHGSQLLTDAHRGLCVRAGLVRLLYRAAQLLRCVVASALGCLEPLAQALYGAVDLACRILGFDVSASRNGYYELQRCMDTDPCSHR